MSGLPDFGQATKPANSVRASYRTVDGRTSVHRIHEAGSLRLRHREETSEAIFVKTAGGLVSGDRLDIAVDIGPAAIVTLTSAAALADRQLGSAVARNKSMFFAEKAADGEVIDYEAAVGGKLQLAPAGEARAALATDYARMVEDGLLLEDAEPFEALIERCADIAERANRAVKG